MSRYSDAMDLAKASSVENDTAADAHWKDLDEARDAREREREDAQERGVPIQRPS